MGVGVQREGRIGVAQDSGQRFGIHAAGEGMGGEGVAQVVEADAGQPRPKAVIEWAIILDNKLELLEVYYGTVFEEKGRNAG